MPLAANQTSDREDISNLSKSSNQTAVHSETDEDDISMASEKKTADFQLPSKSNQTDNDSNFSLDNMPKIQVAKAPIHVEANANLYISSIPSTSQRN